MTMPVTRERWRAVAQVPLEVIRAGVLDDYLVSQAVPADAVDVTVDRIWVPTENRYTWEAVPDDCVLLLVEGRAHRESSDERIAKAR